METKRRQSGSIRWAWLTGVGLLACVCAGAQTSPAKGVAADDPSCKTPGVLAASATQAAGTRRMAALLARIARETDPQHNRFDSAGRAEALARTIRETSAPDQLVNLIPQYAIELLRAGKSEVALQQFLTLQRMVKQHGIELPERNRSMFQTYVGVSFLRIGEQQNCLLNHNADSCLFPLEGGGIHQVQFGSRNAIKVFSQQLAAEPDDLRLRWLLNVAYMTVGEYPDKVPPPWRIDPAVFKSNHDLGRFPDIAGSLGLDINDLAGGVVAEDFDGDGFLDLMISSWSLTAQLRYFRNNGDGTFSDRTAESGLAGITGGLNMIHGDYNNDGRPDVLVLRGAWMGLAGRQPNSLLKNLGNGVFEDVTEAAGLLSFHPTQTAVWFDYDGDGWLDLYIGNESIVGDIHVCELYRNNRDGTFTECASGTGLAVAGFVKAVTAGDYNGDGRPDLYLSLRDQPNLLFRNDGAVPGEAAGKPRWKFTEVSETAGVTEPTFSFPAWFWDYDNDGWTDLFVAGYNIRDVGDVAAEYFGAPTGGEKAKLFRNNGNGTFTDATASVGLDRVLHAMGSNFGDLDNDGFPDFYVATGDPDLATLIPNRMFRNAGGKLFQEVTTSGGFGHLQKGHAVAFADLDNDGDQDVYTVMGGAYTGDNAHNVLFENPGHGNAWIVLKLEGVQSNASAIGTRIRIVARAADGREYSVYKTVGSGGSFGASPLRQHIGLAKAASIDRVELFWPATGRTEVLRDLAPNQYYKIREGSGTATPWLVKRMEFKRDATKKHAHGGVGAAPSAGALEHR